MADSAAHNGTSMYCHACHYQWERQGDNIECPSCHSASTEIITLGDDPNHFYNMQPEQRTTPDSSSDAATPSPATSEPASQTVPQPDQDSNPNTENTSSNPDQSSGNGQTPHPTVQFTVFNVPLSGMTFFATRPIAHPVPTTEQQPAPHQPQQPSSGPALHMPPIIHFSFPIIMHGFPHEAPRQTQTQQPQPESQQANGGVSPQAAAEQSQANEDQQHPSTQQPPNPENGPHHRVTEANMIETLLTMFFSPTNAIFGDAVYSQEAFDRILSQLRDQAPAGGAPPASQAAIDKLALRDLDVESKCVVCVEDMPRGEKVAVLPCSHSFHGECVTPWLKLHNTCPVCRRSVEVDETDAVKKSAAGAPPVVFGPQRPGNHQAEQNGNAMDCS